MKEMICVRSQGYHFFNFNYFAKSYVELSSLTEVIIFSHSCFDLLDLNITCEEITSVTSLLFIKYEMYLRKTNFVHSYKFLSYECPDSFYCVKLLLTVLLN